MIDGCYSVYKGYWGQFGREMGRFGAETSELEGKLNFYIVKTAKNGKT
jgi:hypothetical protein